MARLLTDRELELFANIMSERTSDGDCKKQKKEKEKEETKDPAAAAEDEYEAAIEPMGDLKPEELAAEHPIRMPRPSADGQGASQPVPTIRAAAVAAAAEVAAGAATISNPAAISAPQEEAEAGQERQQRQLEQ